MKITPNYFNLTSLYITLKRIKLILFLNWTNIDTKIWLNFMQIRLNVKLKLVKTSIDLYKNLLEKSLLNKLNYVAFDSLILNLIQEKKSFSLTSIIEALPSEIYIMFLSLNNNIYSLAQIKTIKNFNYNNKINEISYLILSYLKFSTCLVFLTISK